MDLSEFNVYAAAFTVKKKKKAPVCPAPLFESRDGF